MDSGNSNVRVIDTGSDLLTSNLFPGQMLSLCNSSKPYVRVHKSVCTSLCFIGLPKARRTGQIENGNELPYDRLPKRGGVGVFLFFLLLRGYFEFVFEFGQAIS